MVKISEFMIAIVFISVFMLFIGTYMSEMNANYGVNYDNTSLEAYNQLSTMQTLSKNLEEKSDIKEKTTSLDIIGGYVTGAFNVLKLTKTSFNAFDAMANQAITDAKLGAAGEYLRIAISTAALILIVIGVLISAIMKWYL